MKDGYFHFDSNISVLFIILYISIYIRLLNSHLLYIYYIQN